MAINFNYLRTRVVKYTTLCIATVVAIIATGMSYDLSKSDWSGWVQALGSISALGVAIFVMARQNRHSIAMLEETEKRTYRRRAAAVSAIGDRVHIQLINCIDDISNAAGTKDARKIQGSWATTRAVVSEAKAAISAIPAYELGSYEAVQGLQQTNEALGLFIKAADAWDGDKRIAKTPDSIVEAMKTVRIVSEKARSTLVIGLTDLNR